MPSSRSSSERTGSIQSHEENRKTAPQTKSDPNTALYEEQPIAVNSQPGTGATFSLRSMQHRDRDGKVITDPDLSNPTRNRQERPLDTIRAFEAAIEAHHKQNRM